MTLDYFISVFYIAGFFAFFPVKIVNGVVKIVKIKKNG
jgi:hypothetical protein